MTRGVRIDVGLDDLLDRVGMQSGLFGASAPGFGSSAGGSGFPGTEIIHVCLPLFLSLSLSQSLLT